MMMAQPDAEGSSGVSIRRCGAVGPMFAAVGAVALMLCGTVGYAGDPDAIPKDGKSLGHHPDADLEAKRAKNTGKGMPSILGPFPDTVNMEFLGQLTNAELGVEKLVFTGASFLSDIWGWTSPDTGDEYAIVGTSSGVAFARITNGSTPGVPTEPEFLGIIPTTDPDTLRNFWWDMKTFNNHVYFTTEVNGAGVGVFELTQLDGKAAVEPGTPLAATRFFPMPGYVRAHNIAINEESRRAYLVGVTQTGLTDDAIVILDLGGDPLAPSQLGFIDNNTDEGDGGVVDSHDVQVVSYTGPDPDHVGKEILVNFNGNERNIQFWDVSDPTDPRFISAADYPGATFSHQGWFTEDRHFVIHGDEADEEPGLQNPQDPDLPDRARTYILDVGDLDSPQHTGFFDSPDANIDHNLFVKDERIYQAHYIAGVRVLSISPADGGIALQEIAHMDTEPRIPNNNINFNINRFVGPWGVYPFFESGKVIASDGLNGLIVMRLAE